jgi:hypothetical protein
MGCVLSKSLVDTLKKATINQVRTVVYRDSKHDPPECKPVILVLHDSV